MKKLLIVDDDPALAELIAEFCRDAGFSVRAVTNSKWAYAEARNWRPDLITLDLEMPGMDGTQVLRKLQGDELTAGIPVVIVSVVAKGALEEGFLKGARLVFEKPLILQSLVTRLKEVVSAAVPQPAPIPPPFVAYPKLNP